VSHYFVVGNQNSGRQPGFSIFDTVEQLGWLELRMPYSHLAQRGDISTYWWLSDGERVNSVSLQFFWTSMTIAYQKVDQADSPHVSETFGSPRRNATLVESGFGSFAPLAADEPHVSLSLTLLFNAVFVFG
jgi:hypothetical protein